MRSTGCWQLALVYYVVSFLVVSVILIGVCACADSSCTDDRKASSDGVFAPKNSAVYLDEVEASLIEEELTDNERRKVADQLLRTASTSRNAVSGKSYKLPEVENSATIAQKVADELKPQLETMMAEQKSDLEKKVVHEVRNGVRRMEKRQKKQLDEMSRTQRELLEANSNGLFFLNPDDGDGNGKLEGEVNDAVELVEFEDEAVNVRKRQVQNETAKTAEEHDDGAKSVTQQETPLNDTNVADADVNTLAETADVLQMEADRTVGGDENPEPLPLPPRTHGARKRTEPKRFSSELRVNGGNGSYIKHLEETGRRPGGPLPASKDAVDVATVGLAMDRDSSSLRATLASL